MISKVLIDIQIYSRNTFSVNDKKDWNNIIHPSHNHSVKKSSINNNVRDLE